VVEVVDKSLHLAANTRIMIKETERREHMHVTARMEHQKIEQQQKGTTATARVMLKLCKVLQS